MIFNSINNIIIFIIFNNINNVIILNNNMNHSKYMNNINNVYIINYINIDNYTNKYNNNHNIKQYLTYVMIKVFFCHPKDLVLSLTYHNLCLAYIIIFNNNPKNSINNICK